MLEKCGWTDRDFDLMGWHDATIHAMAVDWDPVVLEDGRHGATLLLDSTSGAARRRTRGRI